MQGVSGIYKKQSKCCICLKCMVITPIERTNRDNLGKIVHHFPHKHIYIYYDPSLEMSLRDISNVGTQCMFSLRAKENCLQKMARLPCTVGSASDSGARGPGFHTWSGHILSFLLQLNQEGKLLVTGESFALSTFKPAYLVTSIKGSPALSSHMFWVP